MTSGDFMTVEAAASELGVSVRHARRLADSGAITPVARGLVDTLSVERYRRSQRQGRTRAWAEHTAWAAVALLAGHDTDWLGATQTSRLRGALRSITNADDLATRMRDRAKVRTFAAHPAALPRLTDVVAPANLRQLGMTDAVDGSLDGYLAAGELDAVVRSLALREDPSGKVTLRTTGFDFDKVRQLVDTTALAAMDAATSIDPRLRGLGQRTLDELLEAYR